MERRLTLAPEISEATRLNAWLDEVFADAAVPAGVAEDLRLCLNEAVANVILYAFQPEDDPRIEVEFSGNERSAAAVVIDNGREFNPLEREARDKLTDLEHDVAGGFGVQLIRQTASALGYERVGNENRLRIVCGPSR
ncbi:MAG: ATP-binding protein [Bauldia sp.]|nr:ATP-binding protein [Bauldia sp.]